MSDSIKAELPEQCLKHVLSIESAMDSPHWLKPQRLAEIIDEYVANVGVNPRVAVSFLGQREVHHTQNAAKPLFGKGNIQPTKRENSSSRFVSSDKGW